MYEIINQTDNLKFDFFVVASVKSDTTRNKLHMKYSKTNVSLPLVIRIALARVTHYFI